MPISKFFSILKILCWTFFYYFTYTVKGGRQSLDRLRFPCLKRNSQKADARRVIQCNFHIKFKQPPNLRRGPSTSVTAPPITANANWRSRRRFAYKPASNGGNRSSCYCEGPGVFVGVDHIHPSIHVSDPKSQIWVWIGGGWLFEHIGLLKEAEATLIYAPESNLIDIWPQLMEAEDQMKAGSYCTSFSLYITCM